MATKSPQVTALKIAYKGEIHRIRIDLGTFSLPELQQLFVDTFKLANGSFVIQYQDPEGDLLNVVSEAEFVEAVRVFTSFANTEEGNSKSLRFVAVTHTQLALKEKVADPILKAVEKLVATLNAAMEKVRQEEWAQRAHKYAQDGYETTNEALSKAAQDARVSLEAARESTNEALSKAATVSRESLTKAASVSRESFETARQTIQEIPFDEVLKETAEGLKVAAEGFSTFAQELVEEIKTYHGYENVATTTTPPPQEAAPAAEAAPAQAPAPVEKEKETEWEEVAEPPKESPREPTEAEKKWAVELVMIQDVLPEADVSRTIEFLEQSQGNVTVVINSLMEDM